ncbi:DNA ligase B [compost metagenome]
MRGLGDWLDLQDEDLQSVPGLGESSRQHLLHAFDQARQQPFARWLSALGVPAAIPLKPTLTWADLLQRDAEQWLAEPGIGPGRSAQLLAFFRSPEVQIVAEQLRRHTIEGF